MKPIAIAISSGMALALTFTSAKAATVVSDNFYIAQGFAPTGNPNQGVFDTTETSGVNVSPGANFTLNASVIAQTLSTTGFTFVNGVMGGYSGSSFSSYSSSVFSVMLDAAYVGPTPLDAAASPDYKLQLNITSISIWAASFSPQGESSTLGWTETTAGNAQTQTQVSIETNPGPNWLYLTNYVNLAWTPGGFQSTGEDQLRTFGLAQSIPENFALEGFQVSGNIVLTYTAVPEPATTGLLLVAASLGVVVFRSRRALRSA